MNMRSLVFAVLVAIFACPSDSKQQRIQMLESAMESIKQIYRDDASKIAASSKVEEWYATLSHWPEAAEAELLDDYPIDSVNDTSGTQGGIRNLVTKSRSGIASSSKIAFVDDGAHSAMLLDGKHSIHFPPLQPFTWTESFTLCTEMKWPQEYEDATVLHCLDGTKEAGEQGIEVWIMNGQLYFSLRGSGSNNGLVVHTQDKLPILQWFHLSLVYAGTRSAVDVECFVDGKRWPLRIDQDNLRSDFRIDPSVLTQIGASSKRGGLQGAMIDRLQFYRTDLTSIEIAALATDKAFVTWGELNAAERRLWSEHYVKRIDAQCRYHRESFQHYFKSLSELLCP